MEDQAWPRVRGIVGSAPTFRSLASLDFERLEAAKEAARQDLSERGPKEAYARGLRDGNAWHEEPCDYFDSVRVFLYACPAILELARLCVAVIDHRPIAHVPNWSMDELWWEAHEELRDLGAHHFPETEAPELVGSPSMALADDASLTNPVSSSKMFPSPDSDEWMKEVREVQSRISTRSWNAISALDEYDTISYPLGIAFEAVGGNARIDAYAVIAALDANQYDGWFALSAWGVFQALPLLELADVFRRAAQREFGNAAPLTWRGGQSTVGWLLQDDLPADALALLNRINPEDYEAEIVEGLPPIPDEYEDAWGAVDDWNAMVKHWNKGFESEKLTRIVWKATNKVKALQALGDIDAALECVKTFPNPGMALFPVDGDLRTNWDRIVAFFEGFEAGRADAGRPQQNQPPNMDDIRDSLRRIERQQIKGIYQSNRIVSLVTSTAAEAGAQTELLLEIPRQVALSLKEDWLAYAEFEKQRDALLRGLRATASVEAQESVTSAARDLVGSEAWALLAADSRDDLLGAQIIKDTWGKANYALVAVGWCRAFERELRLALGRNSPRTVEELDRTTFGQLLSMATVEPPGSTIQRIGQRADAYGLNPLRNDAVHASPTGFFVDKFKKLRSVLFRHGLENEGLFQLVVGVSRDWPGDQSVPGPGEDADAPRTT